MMNFAGCKSCGRPVSPGSVFCAYCGTRIIQAASAAPSASVRRLRGGIFGETDYVIDQKFLSLQNVLAIKNRSGNLLACVKQENASFGPRFWFETTDGARLGEVHGNTLSARPSFEVYDASGRLVAFVKKKLFSLLSSQWLMEDSTGTEVAKIAGNIWQHDYRVENPNDLLIAQIHRRWVSAESSYCVEITNLAIKPFLVLSYVIAMDHVEDKEHETLSGRPVMRF